MYSICLCRPKSRQWVTPGMVMLDCAMLVAITTVHGAHGSASMEP